MPIAAAILILLQQAPADAIDWDKEFGVEERVRDPATGEFPVDPYEQSNANAGATPFAGESMAQAFAGKEGIRRIVKRTVELSRSDARIADIFESHDMVRLERTLFEQFCYILGGGCDYTGRDMASAHKDMGLRKSDLNALVENLQMAMREQAVPFSAQYRLLSKLAPMSAKVIER